MNKEVRELHQPDHQALSECLNTSFQISSSNGQSARLTLKHVSTNVVLPHQEHFSILFHGPPAPFFFQGSYVLNHEKLGEFDLFVVPVGKVDGGYEYEAIFNRIR